MATVDSSVGGKTGVNHALGKNMIGAFHQPHLVLVDTQTLSTLPARELASGFSEVVKYGLIGDPELFAWLEANMGRLLARDARVCRILGSIQLIELSSCEGSRLLRISQQWCSGWPALLCASTPDEHAPALLVPLALGLASQAGSDNSSMQALTHAIEQSCVNKARVVALDEREAGVRATLNLGHTFGHAMETWQGYGDAPACGPFDAAGKSRVDSVAEWCAIKDVSYCNSSIAL